MSHGDPGALDGTCVLDLTQQLPGPYATLLLAALGARVIKIEPPQSDMARTLDPPMFERVNAGKESVVLNLKAQADRRALQAIAAKADVLVEGFRPGTADRLGAGYEALSAANPGLVYCSISGFGADGPYRDVPGHDLNYLGVAGGFGPSALAAAEGEATEIGMPVIDMAAGSNAALSILAALIRRARTGRGEHLDVAMLDPAVFWSRVKDQHLHEVTGEAEPTYGVFIAGDGARLGLGVMEDKFWVGLCRALDWDDWAADPSLATHAQRRGRAQEVRARLSDAVRAEPRDTLITRLLEHDVPATPVNPPADAARDPQVAHRGLIGADGTLRPPLPAAIAADLAAAPAFGADTDAVRAEFGA